MLLCIKQNDFSYFPINKFIDKNVLQRKKILIEKTKSVCLEYKLNKILILMFNSSHFLIYMKYVSSTF
jgi:hypothetical protein